ncbi:BON domain-containing protein [Nitrospira sp. Nam80]|jgi:osmotically-inducible protein OsmY
MTGFAALIRILAGSWAIACALCVILTGCSLATGSALMDANSDSAISKEVEAKLAGDQFGGLTDILVTTEAGVVTLVGTVEQAERKARAADLARQVKGVKRVKNDLDIRPPRAE